MIRPPTLLKTTTRSRSPSPTSTSTSSSPPKSKLHQPTSHTSRHSLTNTCPATKATAHLSLPSLKYLVSDDHSEDSHRLGKKGTGIATDTEFEFESDVEFNFDVDSDEGDEESDSESPGSEYYAGFGDTHGPDKYNHNHNRDWNETQKAARGSGLEFSRVLRIGHPVITFTDDDTVERIVINSNNGYRSSEEEEKTEDEKKHRKRKIKCLHLDTAMANAYAFQTSHHHHYLYHLPEIEKGSGIQGESTASPPASPVEEFDAWASVQGDAGGLLVDSEDEDGDETGDEDGRSEGREDDERDEKWVSLRWALSSESSPCVSHCGRGSEEDSEDDFLDSLDRGDGEVGLGLGGFDFVVVGEDGGEEVDVDGDWDDVGGSAEEKKIIGGLN
ncbi:hypothetical protein IFR05_016959, partial [Cadophora sp. M221]